MNDATLMSVIHCIADSGYEFHARANVQMPSGGVLHQRTALNELHRKIGLWAQAGVGGSGFIDLGDPGMLQTAERLGFLLETAQQLVIGDAQLDHLQSHDAVGVLLLGLIHGSHAAFSQQGENAIGADAGRS